MLVPFVDGFPQQACYVFRPILCRVKLGQIFKFAQKMDEAYLVVKEVEREISAVPVCDGYHVFQGFAEFVLKHS